MRAPHNRTAGVGTAGVGTAGVGTAGVDTAGVGTAGVGTAGVGTAGVGTPGSGRAGVGAPGAPVRRSRVATLGLLAAVTVISLSACTAGSSASSDSATAANNAVATNAAAAETQRNAAAGSAASGAAGETAPAAEDPTGSQPGNGGLTADQLAAAPVDDSEVIKTADLAVQIVIEPVAATDDAAEDRQANAAARAAAIAAAAVGARSAVTAAGGFQAGADGGGSAMSLTLRVPAAQYDAIVDKIAALGDLTNRTESSQDVTAEVVDVNSRLESMTASVARVRALLAAATDIADVIAIESELAVREANLESLQQQQAYLGGQVAMSTVSLSLNAVTKDAGAAEPTEPDTGFVAGVKAGWATLLVILGAIAGAGGALLPFLPLIAAGVLVVWWLLRRTRRGSRREPAAAETSGGRTTEPAAAEPAAEPAAGPFQEARVTPSGAQAEPAEQYRP